MSRAYDVVAQNVHLKHDRKPVVGKPHDTRARERITEGEIRTVIRANGVVAVEEVEAVVFETDGSFSVIKTFKDTPATALNDV